MSDFESIKQENDQLMQEKQAIELELTKVKSLVEDYESQVGTYLTSD